MPSTTPCPLLRGDATRGRRGTTPTLHKPRDTHIHPLSHVFSHKECRLTPDLRFLLLLAGDIETNQSPTYPCPVYKSGYSWPRGVFQCSSCTQWLCLKHRFSGHTPKTLPLLPWQCSSCQGAHTNINTINFPSSFNTNTAAARRSSGARVSPFRAQPGTSPPQVDSLDRTPPFPQPPLLPSLPFLPPSTFNPFGTPSPTSNTSSLTLAHSFLLTLLLGLPAPHLLHARL